MIIYGALRMLLAALSWMVDTDVILDHPPLLYVLMMYCELFSLKTWSSSERVKHLYIYETIGLSVNKQSGIQDSGKKKKKWLKLTENSGNTALIN